MAVREVSLRTLRAVRIVLIGMVFLYVWVGETVGPEPKPVDPLLRIVVYALAASIIPTAIWLRSRELKRAKDRLVRQPGDVGALRRWRAIQLVVLACFLAIPLYGLVLRFQGETLVQALPFYIAGLALMSFLPLYEAEKT